jgi:hypothetical protein
MAFARQTLPTLGMGPLWFKKNRAIVTWAGVIATVFGIAAFLLLVWRDHGHPKIMLNEQSAPAIASSKGTTATSATLSKQATQPVGAPQNPATSGTAPSKHEFSLTMSSGEQQAGPVRLRLMKTDPAKNLYDMRVISGHRWSTHRHLKMNEPFWVAAGRGTGAIELVVAAIRTDSVSGYWTESKRSPHVRAKRR